MQVYGATNVDISHQLTSSDHLDDTASMKIFSVYSKLSNPLFIKEK